MEVDQIKQFVDAKGLAKDIAAEKAVDFLREHRVNK